MRAFYFTAVLCCAVASAARAQNLPGDTTRLASDSSSLLDPRLKVGARVLVRPTSLSPGEVDGRIREIRRDTLVIDRGKDEPLTIPVGEVSHLSVRTLAPTRDEMAAAFGTIGFLGGTAWYFAFCSHNRETCRKDIEEARQDTTNTASIPTLFSLYAFGSALLGGAIGAALGVAPWENVDKPLRLSVIPMRRGVMLVATIPIGRRTLR
jgi:hypothetical protein